MANTKELKNRFNDYLNEHGQSNHTLQQCVDRFGLRMFDVFLLGIKKYKRGSIVDKYNVFSQIVSPGLKYLLDNNFGDMYFKPKTYAKYRDLFIIFMGFCEANEEYINGVIFQDEGNKLENSLDGKYGMFEKKAFIKERHEFIKNNKGENGDKFRKYLAEIYGELNSKQIKQLYELFFKAYEKCSKINYKNKKREKGKKINAFDAVFPELSDDLSKINVRGNSLEIKSIFGKYLNFIPIYRDRIKEILDDDISILKGRDIQDRTKESIIDSIRDPNGANYDIVDGEVVAPLDNYGIFPDLDPVGEGNVEDTEKVSSVNSNNDQKGKKDDDPNQDKLYTFEPDKEEWWNR